MYTSQEILTHYGYCSTTEVPFTSGVCNCDITRYTYMYHHLKSINRACNITSWPTLGHHFRHLNTSTTKDVFQTTPWARCILAGFGLLGEQRAESIHARFLISYLAVAKCGNSSIRCIVSTSVSFGFLVLFWP